MYNLLRTTTENYLHYFFPRLSRDTKLSEKGEKKADYQHFLPFSTVFSFSMSLKWDLEKGSQLRTALQLIDRSGLVPLTLILSAPWAKPKGFCRRYRSRSDCTERAV